MQKWKFIFILFLSVFSFKPFTNIVPANASSTPSPRTLNIPLVVQEKLGVERVLEPVQSGIPLPRGAQIFSTSGLSILNGASGQTVDADFVVTARWGGSPSDTTKPIKWILATFKCSVSANGSANFILTDYRSLSPETQISLDKTSETGTWIINTGSATFEIATSGFNLFKGVKVNGQELVTDSQNNGPYYTLEGIRYNASQATSGSQISIFRQGNQNQTLTLKVKGAHRTFNDADDDDLDFNTYLTFYAGSSRVRIQHTVQNNRNWVALENNADFRNMGSPHSVYADEIGLELNLNLGNSLVSKVGISPTDSNPFSNTDFTQNFSIYQDSSGDASWDLWKNSRNTGSGIVDSPIYTPAAYVSFKGFQIKRGSASVSTGDKMSGYFDISGDRGGVTVAIKDFWQNYPKAVRFTSDKRLQVALFPDDFRARHTFRVGEQKTHDILLYFHTPIASDVANTGGGFQQPLMALASPSWCSEICRVIPTVSTPTNNSFRFSTIDANEALAQKDVTPQEWDAYQVRQIQGPGVSGYSFSGLDEAIPSSQMYSWMDYGDMPIDFEQEVPCQDPSIRSVTGQYGWKYDGDYGLMVDFLRSGDFRFFNYGMAAVHHVSDIDMMHHGRQSGRGIHDFRDGGMFGHSQHQDDGVLNPHRNGDPNQPCGTAGAWNGTPTSDMIYGAQAITLAYCLTGEPPLSESLLDIADWTAFYALTYDTDAGRSTSNVLDTLTPAYELTGSSDYQTALSYASDNNAVLQNPLQAGWMSGRLGDALGRYVSVLRERDDSTRDNQLATLASADQSLDSYSGDAFRADAYSWAALLLPKKKDYLQKASEAFTSAVLWPAWKDNLYGIQNVWQIKEWVNALRSGHVFQLATYDSLEGPKFAPSNTTVTPQGGAATQNTAPLAQISGGSSRLAQTSETVSFDGSTSSDAETSATNLHYLWDFGDGVSAVGQTANHIYEQAGTWIARLSVSDGESVSLAQQTVNVTFKNHAPVANAGADVTSPLSVSISFDGSNSSDPDEQALNYSWNFGDGQTATGAIVLHAFLSIGEFTVTLTASDGELNASDTLIVSVKALSNTSNTITFQNGVNGYTGSKDTRLWSKAADVNYGGETELFVGRQNYPELNSLIGFDLKSLPSGAKIDNATLELTVAQNGDSATVEVHQVTTDWTEGTGCCGKDGATWTFFNGTQAWTKAGGDFSSEITRTFTAEVAGQKVNVDITALVQKWVLGTANNGLALTLNQNNNYQFVYLSSQNAANINDRPKLTVTYTPVEEQAAEIKTVRLGTCDTCTQSTAFSRRVDENNPTSTGIKEDVHPLGLIEGGVWVLSRFDTSAIPSTAKIKSARIKVRYQKGDPGWPWDQVLKVYALTNPSGMSAWDSNDVSFNKRSGTQNWTASGGSLKDVLGDQVLIRHYDAWNYADSIHEEWWELPIDLVQQWINNPTSNQGIALKGVKTSYGSAGGWISEDNADPSLRPFLEIDYEGVPNSGTVPNQVDGIKVSHDGLGRTFITWNEKTDPSNFAYRIYRYSQPITANNILRAERIAEVEKNGTAEAKLLSELMELSTPRRWVARENEGELNAGTGLYVYTPSQSGSSYYVITYVLKGQENVQDFSTANATSSPLSEVVGDGLPVKQLGPYTYEYYGTHDQWVYAFWPGDKFQNDSQFPVLFRLSTPNPFNASTVHPIQFTYGGYGTDFYTIPPYNVVSQDTIVITWEDRTPYYDTYGGHANYSWYVGYRDNLGKVDSAPSQGVFRYYGIEASRFITKWLTQGSGKSSFNIDPYRVYAWGGSKGGTGVLFTSLDAPELFAAAQANLPSLNWYDEDSCGNNWTTNTFNFLAGKASDGVKDANGVLTTEALDTSKRLSSLITQETQSFPTLFIESAWDDGTLQWDQDQINFTNVIKTSGLPITFAWKDGGHDTSLSGNLSYGLLNQAVIGFSNCSLASSVPPANAFENCSTSTNYGTGALNGEPLGYEHSSFPEHVSPDLSSIIDTASQFHVKLYVESSESTYQGTVDITPRRVQNFLPYTGSSITWENFDSSGVKIQSGTVTVNSQGLWTIPSFIISKNGNTLSAAMGSVIPPDTTPPTVSITHPSQGSIVSGTVTLSVNASDAGGIQKVVYSLDGQDVATVSSSPFSYSFDTNQKANGSHTLLATAYDTSNNIGTSQTLTFTISNSGNQSPQANAGVDIQANENSSITLDGSLSSDPDGDSLTYAWAQKSGSAVTLSSSSISKPTFTAPEVTEDTALQFELTVSDGLATATDSMIVTVKQVSDPTSSTLTLSIDNSYTLYVNGVEIGRGSDWTQAGKYTVNLKEGDSIGIDAS
ncbi:MAG: DNRLRE domain-containing protein, partial [Chlamydiae bacterium]|nr:DNRLRE domain-containing protein [Chlamydiota bacterium]